MTYYILVSTDGSVTYFPDDLLGFRKMRKSVTNADYVKSPYFGYWFKYSPAFQEILPEDLPPQIKTICLIHGITI